MDLISDCFCTNYIRNMKIKKVKLNEDDFIANYLPANYTDSFECVFNSDKRVSADDLMVAFWTASPEWINKLFWLRDKIVKPFGIQPGSNRESNLLENAIRSNGSYRFFKVINKSENETTIGADDKHLKMYFSIKTITLEDPQRSIIVSTVVHFHNWLGKAYFYIIYPFHLFIAPAMIRSSITNILKKS